MANNITYNEMEEYLYMFDVSEKNTKNIKEYLCDPFNNYIYLVNNNNHNNIILRIKNINRDFAFIKNNNNKYYIKWNIINYNNININNLEDLKNQIKVDLNNNKNYYQKLFLLLLLQYLKNKKYIILFKYIFTIILEFISIDKIDEYNIFFLKEFLNQDIWYNELEAKIKFINNNNKNKETSNINLIEKILNDQLTKYIFIASKKYRYINSEDYNVIDIVNNYPPNLLQQIGKDFYRGGTIIFINEYNYSLDLPENIVNNHTEIEMYSIIVEHYKEFIKNICIEYGINNDNMIDYITKVIMNFSHQGAQSSISTQMYTYIYSPRFAIFKAENINMFFKKFIIVKNDDDIMITIYLNSIFKIISYNNDKENEIYLGNYRSIEKYYIRINSKLNIEESNMKNYNYIYFNDNILKYRNDIILNYDSYNSHLNESKEYYLKLHDDNIINILNDKINNNNNKLNLIYNSKLNLIYNLYCKTYNLFYYILSNKFFNYMTRKNNNLLLNELIHYYYYEDKDNNFLTNFFAKSVLNPIKSIYPKYDTEINYNIMNNNRKDILIISYNEGGKQFDDYDVFSILYKVLTENPKIIVVCTQESAGFTTIINAYQKVLQKYLNKYNYELLCKSYYTSSRFSLLKFNPHERNVRTYVYKRVDFKGIKYTEFIKSTKSGLSSIKEKTLNKGSIALRLELEEKNNKFNFIIVNSHLFSNKIESNNIASSKRKKEFFDLIHEFKLPNYYNQKYNIFFCGDLNFKLLNPKSYLKNLENIKSNNLKNIKIPGISSKEISNKIIYNYLNNNKNKFTEKYKKTNELIKILNNQKLLNMKLNDNYKYLFNQLMKNFKENILELGYDLTCKYKIDEKINNKKKKELEKGIINRYNFKLKKNNKEIEYVPSMCDRILFASKNNLVIEPKNFNMYLLPNKTDHKLLTLSFELNNYEIII